MKLDKINGQMKGYKMYADVVPIKMIATDGGDFMDELRWIEQTIGIHETYNFFFRNFDIEGYKIFMDEQIKGVSLSLCTVFIVVVFVTANLTVTLLVVLAVILVDLYMLSLIYFWGDTLN